MLNVCLQIEKVVQQLEERPEFLHEVRILSTHTFTCCQVKCIVGLLEKMEARCGCYLTRRILL